MLILIIKYIYKEGTLENFDNIDLNLCKCFLVVAKSGSISKAAEILYVSQPAISRNIKLLEESLECKLFNRTAKGVELTADAERLMYYFENAYNTMKTGFKLLKDSNDLLKGQIKIGVPTHIMNIQVHSYQAYEIKDRGKILNNNVGSVEHFDIKL